jgi:orotate phosphoribosyltransferase
MSERQDQNIFSNPTLYFSTKLPEKAAELIPEVAEILAGLELGGVSVVTALSLTTELPAVFVRKEARAYGTVFDT